MRTLTLGFSKSTKKFALFSWALRAWDRVDYSHVYMVFENARNPDIPLVYQASSTMLNFMSKQVFLEHSAIVEEFQVQVTDELYNDILRECMANAGRPYSLSQIAGIALADICKLKSNPFPNKFSAFVCSEWIAKIAVMLGCKFDKSLDLVKPSDVNKVLKLQLI